MQQIEERRYLQSQIRSADSSGRVLAGLAVRYNALSEDMGNWRERIAPSAFKGTLADGHNIRMQFGHDSNRHLADTKSGTLCLTDTRDGLAFRATMPNTTDGSDCLELCKSGLLREMSFGFECRSEAWNDEDIDDDYDDDGRGRKRAKKRIPVRTVLIAHLHEISPVGWAAYGNDQTHIRPELAAAAAASSRTLWPSGAIPLEIRSRVPGIGLMSVEEQMLYTEALRLEIQADR